MSYSVKHIPFTDDDIVTYSSKKSQSEWFVTMNTNQSMKNRSKNDPLVRALSRTLSELISGNILPNFIVTKDGYSTDDNREITVRSVIEVGPRSGQLHAHMYISIKHRSNIKLDYNRMRVYFSEQLGLDNIYLNCRFIKKQETEETYKDRIYRYMLKEQEKTE